MAAEYALEEIASQPQVWRQARALAHERAADLPRAGERIAAVGYGTSWFMAEACARRRESLGSKPISCANPSGRHRLTSCAPSQMNSHG
jgi:hypothetical protein